jgi:D-3-phosphoglycerate dehydrogenase
MSRFTVVAAAAEVPSEQLDVEEAVLAEIGAELIDLRARPLDEIAGVLHGADGILTEALGRDRFDAARIAGLERCRVISVYAVGADGIDVDAASKLGIAVVNVPHYCTVEVAEHTIALLLAGWRRLRAAERVARSGSWGLDELRPVHRLAGRTVGLLGFGRIAQEVARRLAGFGVDVVAHDPYADAEAATALSVELCGLDELLRRSDILSIHAPLTDETRALLDRDRLALLPGGAVVVNAGRGGIVDHDALLEALEEGRLAGAALDVTGVEPADPDDPLLARGDVVCTPHMAYYSEESLVELRRSVARNAATVLTGGRPESTVNAAALGARADAP